MKGFVPTPEPTVDAMVQRLFRSRPPTAASRLLDPGCGYGAFIHGVLRWCRRRNAPQPRIVGIELDPDKIQSARRGLKREPGIQLVHGDFLTRDFEPFDYIVGNPPYVAIDGLSEEEREDYRSRFETARGRLDLYVLFWERALELLRPGGRLVFITPEKFMYVETARALRKLLTGFQISEIHFAPEDTFPGLTTYPTITTLIARPPVRPTAVRRRDGQSLEVRFPPDGDSWQPIINCAPKLNGRRALADVALRVSCGVATGADRVFVLRADELPVQLSKMSHPTIAGRELRNGGGLPKPNWRLLIPYDQHGSLLPEDRLGPLGDYLGRPNIRKRLESRTCARRKPWYAFHDSLLLQEILRPKLLCKDITSEPHFWIDREGAFVPRHSVYYVVPRHPDVLDELAHFLNSEEARSWLRSHCQRAANGFLRVQSSVLKKLPVPDCLASNASEQCAAP